MNKKAGSNPADGTRPPQHIPFSDWEDGVEIVRSAREEAARRAAGEQSPLDAASQLRHDAEELRRQERARQRRLQQQALARARRPLTEARSGRRDDDREPVFDAPRSRSAAAAAATGTQRSCTGGSRALRRILVAITALVLLLATGVVILWQYLFSDFRARNRQTQTPPVTAALTDRQPGRQQGDGQESAAVSETLPPIEPIPAPARFEQGIQNILLIGSDTRNDGEHDLADTLLIATIDNIAGKLKLASIQRDTAVYIGGDPLHLKRINESMGSGPEMVMQTVNRNFSLDISDYVAIEFTGVEDIIDALGGIEIDVPEDAAFLGFLNDAIYEQTVLREGWGYEGPSQKLEAGGRQLLSGRQALGYMRVRKSDSDYQRTSRQREVLQLLLDKFLQQDLITMLGIARQGLGLVRTNLGELELLGLATSVLPRFRQEMEQLQIPTPGTFWEREDGVILPGFGLLNPRIHEFIYGSRQYLTAVPEIPAAPRLETSYWLEPGSEAFMRYYRDEFGDQVDAVSREEENRQRQAGYVPTDESP